MTAWALELLARLWLRRIVLRLWRGWRRVRPWPEMGSDIGECPQCLNSQLRPEETNAAAATTA